MKPKNIDIFGKKIPVVFKKDLKDDDGTKACGLYCFENDIIYLDSDLPKKLMIESLYHECFHALMERIGLNQTSISEDVKEIICESFAKFVDENFEPRKKRK